MIQSWKPPSIVPTALHLLNQSQCVRIREEGSGLHLLMESVKSLEEHVDIDIITWPFL